jgi:hypothetical protein
VVVTCASSLASGRAGAAETEPGRTRLHVDTGLVGWARYAAISRGPGLSAEPVDIVGLGVGRPASVSAGSTPYLGLGVGYRVAPRVLLGARFGFGYGRDVGPSGWLSPYFELSPIPGKRVLPFLQLRLGIAGGGGLTPSGGLGGGVHIFPRRSFSIDLGLNIDLLAVRRSVLLGSFPEQRWTDRGFILGATLGFSLWL